MDDAKVAAVKTWPTPKTVKDLQHFLCFTNFYRRFIWGFNAIINTLTTFLKKGLKHLVWNPAAEKAFAKPKTSFTTTSIRKHHEHSKPFMVKVDNLDSGVGAVLSQCFGDKPKFHTVAFFSK